jgi:hypothetical protein
LGKADWNELVATMFAIHLKYQLCLGRGELSRIERRPRGLLDGGGAITAADALPEFFRQVRGEGCEQLQERQHGGSDSPAGLSAGRS